MRYLRPYLALLTIAAMTVACGSSPGSSSGGASSQGGGASQPAASTGGGGGGGANGSITYKITGAYQSSGEIPFVASASHWIDSEGGWLANFKQTSEAGAYIVLNTQTKGQILNYGDATAFVSTTSVSGSPYDCTFTMTKNDSSGLKGSVKCTGVPVITTTTTEALIVDMSADWDVHP